MELAKKVPLRRPLAQATGRFHSGVGVAFPRRHAYGRSVEPTEGRCAGTALCVQSMAKSI